MKNKISLPGKLLKRLPHYLFYLKQLRKNNREFVSNERLATDLNLHISEIREDLENLNESLSLSDIHYVEQLITHVEYYLGYNQKNTAIIAGAGNLGKALLNYPGFKDFGLEILAVFDNDENKIGHRVGDTEIISIDQLATITRRLHVPIGIVTTPPEPAQRIVNKMVESGITGIWNFSSAILKVPDHVRLSNTSLYNDYLSLLYAINSLSDN